MRISVWLYLFWQAFASLCLLLALGVAADLPRRTPLRLVLTALLCGGTAVFAAYSPFPWLRAALLLPVVCLSPLLAFPGIPRRLRGRLAGLSLMLSLMLTGFMRLISPLFLPAAAVLPAAAALPAMGLGLTAALRLRPDRAPLPQCITVEIRHAGARLTLTALVDSGNLLTDVITGLPVVLISRRAAQKLLPVPPDGTLSPGMRLMPIRTVSGTSVMTIFRPDGLRILTGRFWRPARAIIGLSPDGYEGFQALVPAALVRLSPFASPGTTLISSQGG